MIIELSANTNHEIAFDKGVTDVIKLMSIAMIAIHHFLQYALTRGNGGAFSSLYCSQAGYLGVALFFFLSGYGVMKSHQRHQMSFGEFVNKRLLKIILPMLLANLLWAVFLLVFIDKLNVLDLSQKMAVENVSFGNIFLSVLLLNSEAGSYFDGTLWFIKVLLLLYIAFYISSLMKKKEVRLCVLALLCCIVVLIVSCCMNTWMAISVPLFFIGAIMADSPSYISKHFLLFSCSYLAVCVACVWLIADALIIHACCNYLVVLAMIIVAYFVNIRLVGTATILGVLSFEIYLTHNKARLLSFALWEHPSIWMYFLILTLFTILFHFIKKRVIPKY